MKQRIIVSCLIKYKNKFLFIKQNKKDGAYQDCLHLVGGGLEENETLEEAIRREVMEEVHVNLERIEPLLNYKHNEPSMRFLKKLGLI